MTAPGHHQSLALSLRCLRDSAVSLSAVIFSACQDSKIAESEKNELGGLAGELRLFCGTVFGLESLVTQAGDIGSDTPSAQNAYTFLEECVAVLEDVRMKVLGGESLNVQDRKHDIQAKRATLAAARNSSSTSTELAAQIAAQKSETQALVSPSELSTRDSSFSTSQPTEAEVISWLETLNDPINEREPQEYFLERKLAEARLAALPDYPIAAQRWPLATEDFWKTIKHRVLRLFRLPRSFTFVQWALEYAREIAPTQFGSTAPSSDALIDLTDALCNGSVTPLHFAAMLGLPSLCQSLISKGAQVNALGRLGSPLYCALIGPYVLRFRAEADCWKSLQLSMDDSKSRCRAIGKLIESGADCKFTCTWPDGDTSTLAGIALLSSLVVDDASIFEAVMQNGAGLDECFTSLLEQGTMLGLMETSQETLSRLLTCAFDYTFVSNETLPWDRPDEVADTIIDVMNGTHVDFCYQRCGRLPLLRDDAFDFVVRCAILDGEETYFSRLVMDDRFDPNLLAEEDNATNGTIVHLAVGASQDNIIDNLHDAGADFTVTDSHGRTPLMLVESTFTLDQLVIEYNLPTTDTDKDGRNIWHYAAATNDHDLMEWLCKKDPWMEQNKNAVTKEGRTPVIEALEHIHMLRAVPKKSDRPTPVAAHLLIRSAVDCTAGSPPIPLAHLAAAWGELELVNELVDAGVDFTVVDTSGRSALHHLNVSAGPDLVRRLNSLCSSLAVHTNDEQTSMETIILNSFATAHGSSSRSNHPACHGPFSEEAFFELLTSDVRAFRDSSGRGCWARFCSNVLPILLSSGGEMQQLADECLHRSIGCLGMIGALREYEVETGMPAVWCLSSQGDDGKTSWVLSSTLVHVFHRSGKRELSRFYGTPEALELLVAAIRNNMEDLVSMLSAKCIGLDKPLRMLNDISVLEYAIGARDGSGSQYVCSQLLHRVSVAEIQSVQEKLFALLLDKSTPHKEEKLLDLLGRGLDTNIIITPSCGGDDRTMLAQAVDLNHDLIAVALLNHGADPTICFQGENAITSAIKQQHANLLTIAVKSVLTKFDMGKLVPLAKRDTHSVIDLAMLQEAHPCLEGLLKFPEIVEKINEKTPTNQCSPVHLATRQNCAECLKILHKYHADFTLTNDKGQTALHLAIEEGHRDVISFLIQVVPMELVDLNGDTSLDYAENHGDEATLEMFKQHTNGKMDEDTDEDL